MSCKFCLHFKVSEDTSKCTKKEKKEKEEKRDEIASIDCEHFKRKTVDFQKIYRRFADTASIKGGKTDE